jgi:dihydroneopterin aldolase
MKLSEIVDCLEHLKGKRAWTKLSAASKVHYFTIARISRDVIKNPRTKTCEALERALLELYPQTVREVRRTRAAKVAAPQAAQAQR